MVASTESEGKITTKSTELRGIVHGKTIALEQEAGFPEGEIVTVAVKPVEERLPPGEGIRRSAGSHKS